MDTSITNIIILLHAYIEVLGPDSDIKKIFYSPVVVEMVWLH